MTQTNHAIHQSRLQGISCSYLRSLRPGDGKRWLAWTLLESLLGSWRSLPIQLFLSIVHDIMSTSLPEVCGKGSDQSNGTVVSRLAASSLGSFFDFGQASTLFDMTSFLNAWVQG
jgi:hypothetical protein